MTVMQALEARKSEGRETATLRSVKNSSTSASLSRKQGEAWLTRREWEVLSYLSGHAGRYVPAEELVDAFWGGVAETSGPRVMIRRLRRKLGEGSIEQAYGLGYRVTAQGSAALLRECGRCRRPIVGYGREWVCYGCGASGEGPAPAASPRDLGLAMSRRAVREGTREGRPWTAADEAFVLAHVGDMSDAEMGSELERTASAVRGYRAGKRLAKPYIRRGRGERP